MGIHIAASSDESRLLICSVLLDQKFVGVVEDAAIALGGGTGVDAADGLRDGRNDEKPPLGKRLAEERGNVPFVPHPPRQDENEGRSTLQPRKSSYRKANSQRQADISRGDTEERRILELFGMFHENQPSPNW